MDKHLEAEDDGLPTRPSGKWAKEKLFYLERYVNAFETSMRGKPWRRRVFIDLFSGPGKGYIKESSEYLLGSPLIALTTRYPFTDYYFVDMDPVNIEALEKRAKSSNVPQSSIHCLAGDANKQVDGIVSSIMAIDSEFIPRAWQSLNLAFLDPEGFELEWNTVAQLARVGKMDLIVHYSQQGIKRMADRALDSAEETVIDRFFGDTEWRAIYRDHRIDAGGVHRPLMDHYKTKLRHLGYAEIKDDEEVWVDPLMKNRKNAPLYRLLFASKDPLGLKFWHEVTKTGTDGQLQLWK